MTTENNFTDEQNTIREVKLTDATLTVHIPTDSDNIHDAIEEALNARHIDDYTIDQTYEIEEY